MLLEISYWSHLLLRAAMHTTVCLNVGVFDICHYQVDDREAQYSNEGD